MKRTNVLKKERLLDLYANTRLLSVLFHYPEREFSLSDLAKEADVSKSNVGGPLRNLLKADGVKIERLSKIWRVRANTDNPAFRRAKLVANLRDLCLSSLIDVLNSSYHEPKSVVLFGSYRWGTDISTSDIDIAVEDDSFDRYSTVHLSSLADFERKLGRKIQIHQFNRKSVDLNLFNNIANGIVLSGFLEVRP